MEREKFNEIDKIIRNNEDVIKQILQQCKFKTFNYLKQNPQRKLSAIPKKIKEPCESYASLVRHTKLKVLSRQQMKPSLN